MNARALMDERLSVAAAELRLLAERLRRRDTLLAVDMDQIAERLEAIRTRLGQRSEDPWP